ncbi:hypothetical protein MKW92_034422 [Papaver armeniacum]|nr:hypothetical protein MKW92_034422 [Papaver armeniacum]
MCCEVCIRRPRILLVIVLDISQVVGNDVEPNINCTRQETNLTKVSIHGKRCIRLFKNLLSGKPMLLII